MPNALASAAAAAVQMKNLRKAGEAPADLGVGREVSPQRPPPARAPPQLPPPIIPGQG